MEGIKKTFPFIIPSSHFCLALKCSHSFFCHLDLRLKCVVHHTSCKAIPPILFGSVLSTSRTRRVLVRFSCPVQRQSCGLTAHLFSLVWLSIGKISGACRLRGVVGSLYKHVRDVLAKVDLTVRCYGLVLHQLQVLRG